MTFHHTAIVDNVTTLLTDGKTAGCQVLNISTKILLLSGRNHLEAMQKRLVEEDAGLIQQHTLIRINFREDIVTISEDEGTKLSKLANKLIGNVCRDTMLVYHMNTTLTLAIKIENAYCKKYVATRNVHILEVMMGSESLL